MANPLSIIPSPDGFILPKLGYATNALQPSIDQQTMEIHHGKHHAGYVRKLNAALDGTQFVGKKLEETLGNITDEHTGIRNNGGGHYNHSLFWNVLSPDGGKMPEGALSKAIKADFGSYDSFKDAFAKAAGTVFGSGWAWLVMGADGKLFVTQTHNQDNPLMQNLVEKPGTPIMGIDVWEHAYYLKYQNRRGDYIDAFFNIINWNQVQENMKAAKGMTA